MVVLCGRTRWPASPDIGLQILYDLFHLEYTSFSKERTWSLHLFPHNLPEDDQSCSHHWPECQEGLCKFLSPFQWQGLQLSRYNLWYCHNSLLNWCLAMLLIRLHGAGIVHIHKGLYNMSLVTRTPVFGVCDQGRLKLACAATEAS